MLKKETNIKAADRDALDLLSLTNNHF